MAFDVFKAFMLCVLLCSLVSTIHILHGLYSDVCTQCVETFKEAFGTKWNSVVALHSPGFSLSVTWRKQNYSHFVEGP